MSVPSRSIDRKDLKQFALILGIVLLILAGLNWWREHASVAVVMVVIAIASELIALIKPVLIKPVFIVLTTIAKGIGWFNTRLLLSLVFYLMMAPIGLIMRLIRKDLLDRKVNKNASTYWHERKEKKLDPKHYERQF
jgi:polyferredoxin